MVRFQSEKEKKNLIRACLLGSRKKQANTHVFRANSNGRHNSSGGNRTWLLMIRSLRRNSLDSAQNTRRPGADRDDTPCNARPKSLRRRLLLKGRRLDAREIIYAAAAAATLPAPSPQPTTTTTTTDLTYRSAAAVHNNNRWRGTPEGRAADGRPAIEYEWRGGSVYREGGGEGNVWMFKLQRLNRPRAYDRSAVLLSLRDPSPRRTASLSRAGIVFVSAWPGARARSYASIRIVFTYMRVFAW